MENHYESLLFYEELAPEQREALRDLLVADPELADAFAHWQHVRAALREEVEARLPDRRLLVLYALERGGHADALSQEERHEVAAARGALEEAIQTHPALADIVEEVQDACADFEDVWSAYGDESLEKVSPARSTAPDRSAVRPSRRRSGVRWVWRATAAVAVIAFIAVAVLLLQRDTRLITVTTAEDEVRLVELADGSEVRLLGGSSLTYADPEATAAFNRQVELTGRAFFEIVPEQQGFTVETPTALTRVLGTSFGVQADETMTDVVLATGKLALSPKEARDRIVVLEPGQRSRVARNALPSTPTAVDVTEALSWTGLLFFRTTPMREVATHLEQQFGVTVTVASALQDESVDGTFQEGQPIEEVLDALAATLEANVQMVEDDHYRLVPEE